MPNSLLRNRMINPLSGFAPEFDNIFQHLFSGSMDETSEHAFHPRTNLIESESGYLFQVELPGVDPEHVNVEFKDGDLLISGDKEIAKPEENQKILHWQRQSGKFSRSFSFPVDIDYENIDATFKHGILEIFVKKAEKALPRKVEVKIAQ